MQPMDLLTYELLMTLLIISTAPKTLFEVHNLFEHDFIGRIVLNVQVVLDPTQLTI